MNCMNIWKGLEGQIFFLWLINVLIANILGFIDRIFLICSKINWQNDLANKRINMTFGDNLNFDINSYYRSLINKIGSCKSRWIVILIAFNINSPYF